jgi:hypothetical protein
MYAGNLLNPRHILQSGMLDFATGVYLPGQFEYGEVVVCGLFRVTA